MSDKQFLETGNRIINKNSVDFVSKNSDGDVEVKINGKSEKFTGKEAKDIWHFFTEKSCRY
jgi:hypothetical protein